MSDVTVEIEDDPPETPPAEDNSETRIDEALSANDAEHAASEAEEAAEVAEQAADSANNAAAASVFSAEVIAVQLEETQRLIQQHTALIQDHLALVNATQQQQLSVLPVAEVAPIQQDSTPENAHWLSRKWWGKD